MEKTTAHRKLIHCRRRARVACMAFLIVAMTACMILSSIIANNVNVINGTSTGPSHPDRVILQKILQEESLRDPKEDAYEEIQIIELTPSDQDSLELTILPGELPGYTGWARPVTTLVDLFRLVNSSETYATTGQDWSVHLECTHQACLKGGSLFYVRAYGRSILPGRVTDHANGQYTVTILPHDAGRYTLEVVLTFSQRPDWTQLPVPSAHDQPSYEGYLLPGFPLQFTVAKADRSSQQGKALHQLQPSPLLSPSPEGVRQELVVSSNSRRPKWCTAQQLVESSPDSALATGRWLVVNKTRSLPFTAPSMTRTSYLETEKVNEENYMNGFSSLGFQMDYFPLECDLLPLSHFGKPETWIAALEKQHRSSKKVIHMLFVGDSNTRNQHNFWRDYIAKPTNYLNGQMRLTYVDMMEFWDNTFPPSKEKLINITRKYKDDLFFTIFNAGLHEIKHRCAWQGPKPRGRCYGLYQKDVQDFVNLVQNLPSMLSVWQTTMAAWPKWGVYGIPWPLHRGQNFPNEPNICGYINGLAWDVVEKAGIPVMDTYWLTLSRSDHREVISDENPNVRAFYKLVHSGREVNIVLVRKIATMILEAIEKGTQGQRYL